MIARLRSLWLSVNASYWFYPAVFSILAALLAIFTAYLDRHGAAEYLANFEWLEPARPAGASDILTVIAGSMIGVASTVFSITIAAVAYASGNYGPRLLTNFMEDKGNQFSLATFIGTFVYAVMILRVVRAEDESATSIMDAAATSAPGFVPQLSLLVATGLMAVSVGVLVFFLNHIPSSIRINTVLKGIGERVIRQVKHRFPVDYEGTDPEERPTGRAVISQSSGYIKIIDFATLDDIAKGNDGRIVLNVRTGDFVHPDYRICWWIGDGEDEDADGGDSANPDLAPDDIAEDIRGCLSLGGLRTPTQDIEFLMDELVEIALRALSPGINDPFTAITSLHWLGAATAEIGRRNLARGPEQEDYDPERVMPLDDDFRHFLQRGFGGIRASAASSALASKNFLDCLFASATAAASNQRRRQLFDEGRRLMEQARLDLRGPSLEELERRFISFGQSMRNLGI